MTTYNTGNPIGSKDPRDLYDNAENLDEAINTRTAESWEDRLGVTRKTWWGMEQDFQQFLIDSGYVNIGDYGPGLEITARNQIFWRDGEIYRAGAVLELPYTTTGDWGTEEGLFVVVGDQGLRQALVQPVATFNNVADMVASGGLDVGRKVRTLGYYSPGDGGDNDYEIVAAGTGTDNGGSFIDLSGSGLQAKGLFVGNGVNVRQFGAKGDGVTNDNFAVQAASEYSDTIHISSGNYIIGDVVLTRDLVVIGNGGVIISGQINSNSHKLTVRNLKFDYNYIKSHDSMVKGVGSDVDVSFCEFYRIPYQQYPVLFESSDITLIGNTFSNGNHAVQNVMSSSASEVSMVKNGFVKIIGNKFNNISGSPINLVNINNTPGSAEWLSAWDRSNSAFNGATIIGNEFINCAGFCLVYRSYGVIFNSNSIIRCKPPTFQGGNVVCHGNTLTDMDTIAIDFGNVSGGSCIGNTITGSDFAGIEINSSEHVSVASNMVSGTCRLMTSGPASAAIWVQGEDGEDITVPGRFSKNISITDNLVSVGTGQNDYGISVEGVSSQVYVSGNMLEESGQLKNIVSESPNIVVLSNHDNFSFTNQKIQHNGSFQSIVIPVS